MRHVLYFYGISGNLNAYLAALMTCYDQPMDKAVFHPLQPTDPEGMENTVALSGTWTGTSIRGSCGVQHFSLATSIEYAPKQEVIGRFWTQKGRIGRCWSVGVTTRFNGVKNRYKKHSEYTVNHLSSISSIKALIRTFVGCVTHFTSTGHRRAFVLYSTLVVTRRWTKQLSISSSTPKMEDLIALGGTRTKNLGFRCTRLLRLLYHAPLWQWIKDRRLTYYSPT